MLRGTARLFRGNDNDLPLDGFQFEKGIGRPGTAGAGLVISRGWLGQLAVQVRLASRPFDPAMLQVAPRRKFLAYVSDR